MRTLIVLVAILVCLSFTVPAFAERAARNPPMIFSNTPAFQDGSDTDRIALGLRLLADLLQGKQTPGANDLFERSKQTAARYLQPGSSAFFFFDFGDPNLPFNQFAANIARALLLLTPLYTFGYLAILARNVWKERAIPNPLVYAALVIGVMIFLAAFAAIMQGISTIGSALAVALSGSDQAFYGRNGLLDATLRVLISLQKIGGIVALFVLLLAGVELFFILIQLAYRALTMAIWRFIGVIVIPFSVLLEGANPKRAGQVIGEFFQAWFDMVGKIALLLMALSLAASDAFKDSVAIILPAGLLLVVLSWKFFAIPYHLVRDAFARVWRDFFAAEEMEHAPPVAAAVEATRARDIDEQRKRLLGE